MRVGRDSDPVGGALLASGVTAGLVVGWDLVRMLATPPGLPADGGLLAFVLVGWGLAAVVLAPVLVARAHLGDLQAWGAAGWFVRGAIEGGVVFLLAVVLQNPRVPGGDLRTGLLVAFVVVAGAAYAGFSRLTPAARRRIARAVPIIALVGASVSLIALRWEMYQWLRLALHLVIGGAVQSLLSATDAPPRVSRRAPAIVAAVAIAATLGSGALMAPRTARLALHGRSAEAHVYAWLVQSVLDVDGDGATSFFGGRDCDPHDGSVHPAASETPGDGVDSNCGDGDGEAIAEGGSDSLFRASQGTDVLLLSVDALRADRVDLLEEVQRVLGPHARFDRAVSPSPKTLQSCAAMIRGRAVRQLVVDQALRGKDLLWRDRSPTLGHALLAAGHRTITVPTNNIWDARRGIFPGFEAVWAANYDARSNPPARIPHEHRYLRSEHAFPVALDAARATPGPIAVWIHVMESHYSYHVGDRDGPMNAQGHAESLRALDPLLAGFIAEFAEVRGRTPLVAVFGDHGEEFGEHGGKTHGATVHAEQVRVGFLLAGPGVPEGRYDEPVSIGSVPPTLLELLGAPVPPTMTEPSLLRLMDGDGRPPPVAVSERHYAFRSFVGYTGARYRLLRDPVHDVTQLFDGDEDPHETRDLFDEEPEALGAMEALARTWRESH